MEKIVYLSAKQHIGYDGGQMDVIVNIDGHDVKNFASVYFTIKEFKKYYTEYRGYKVVRMFKKYERDSLC